MKFQKVKRGCQVCGKIVPDDRTVYCSDDCELKGLRANLLDCEVAPRRPKKVQVKCLARVRFTACVQEWYFKESYDAKRRACELRKLGFQCEAKSVGELPIKGKNGFRFAKVTILTAWGDTAENVPPEPPRLVEGLTLGERRRSQKG